MRVFLGILMILVINAKTTAQENTSISWLTFEQLEDSLAVKSKKVFINFYADWCVYCKKMDQAAYKDVKVMAILKEDYYAVKMNVETRDTINFNGDSFVNVEFGKKRNPVHEIPHLLASREGIPFSLPAIVLFDKNFQIKKRYFEYISPKRMRIVLEN